MDTGALLEPRWKAVSSRANPGFKLMIVAVVGVMSPLSVPYAPEHRCLDVGVVIIHPIQRVLSHWTLSGFAS
jgi:hypothetical protein